MSSKLLASNIFINWNPVTDNGKINFHINEFLYQDGSVSEFINKSIAIDKNYSIEEIAQKIVTTDNIDPVTNASLTNISGAGIMILIKRISDQILLEAEQELNRTIVKWKDIPSTELVADGTSSLSLTAEFGSARGASVSSNTLTKGTDYQVTTDPPEPGISINTTNTVDGLLQIDISSTYIGMVYVSVSLNNGESCGYSINCLEPEPSAT